MYIFYICIVFFFVMSSRPPRSTLSDTLIPYATLFRSQFIGMAKELGRRSRRLADRRRGGGARDPERQAVLGPGPGAGRAYRPRLSPGDRKSTRLNSSH